MRCSTGTGLGKAEAMSGRNFNYIKRLRSKLLNEIDDNLQQLLLNPLVKVTDKCVGTNSAGDQGQCDGSYSWKF